MRGMRLPAIGMGVVTLVVAGVACSYSPGTFAYGTKSFPGTRASVRCLDIAIERRDDYEGKAVLAYQFGNRCETRQQIDLGTVHVVGRDEAGNEHALMPFDPAGEIRPVPLDARLVGGEVIAYPADQVMVQVCVDAASIAHEQPARWMCFGRKPEALPARPEEALPPSEQVVAPSGDDEQEQAPDRTLIEDDARAEVP